MSLPYLKVHCPQMEVQSSYYAVHSSFMRWYPHPSPQPPLPASPLFTLRHHTTFHSGCALSSLYTQGSLLPRLFAQTCSPTLSKLMCWVFRCQLPCHVPKSVCASAPAPLHLASLAPWVVVALSHWVPWDRVYTHLASITLMPGIEPSSQKMLIVWLTDD